jgi:quercetin dioxygenase-like cupin family protein
MSSSLIPSVAPIALQPGEGDARWFLGFLVTIKSTAETTGGRVAVVEHLGTRGLGSPLHVHRNEDEWFYVTEGELTFWVGGEVVVAPAGSFVYGPRDIPHTFLVSSAEARFLLVTEPAGFEGFMRALSEPAQALTLPPPSVQPPAAELMMATAAEYGIEILGPPGIPA